MTESTAPQPLLRTWLLWFAGTLAFPIRSSTVERPT